MKGKWKLIGNYPIKEYSCGLKSGQKVRLRKDIIATEMGTEKVVATHKAGEIWEVLSGSDEPPVVVWLRRPDGQRCTWDDEPGIFDNFEIVEI